MDSKTVEATLAAELPDLWGEKVFSRTNWGTINYLVGPNGTGKTRFADLLKSALTKAGFKPRYLSAERLAGLEKFANFMGHPGAITQGFNIGQYSNYKTSATQHGLALDAFVVLKEKLDVRIRVEAFLSSLFKRRIRFAEEGGYLKPKMQRVVGSGEYAMKESECHGLKELITMLAFIYDDSFDTLIIDEPELHLHPQFQNFLLSEIRAHSGNPKVDQGKKAFFLITHSPSMLDFRTVDDLKNCIIFHPDKAPTYIENLSEQDEYVLKRLIPRLNTHHKQFFFAQRPIFVEGYRDQQLFSLIQDKRNKLLGANGSCFIDVNGKDEQDFFFRLCKNLEIDAQFVSDLDVLTRGSFRNSVSDDAKCQSYVAAKGIASTLMEGIRQLTAKLDELATAIEKSPDPKLKDLRERTKKCADTDSKRYMMLAATIHFKQNLASALPALISSMDYVSGRLSALLGAFKESGVYLLPKGCLENHLPSYSGDALNVSDKLKTTTFELERDFILECSDKKVIEQRYGELVSILDVVSGACEVDLHRFLGYSVGTLIGTIQTAFERGEITSPESIKSHGSIDWNTYDRILELVSFDTADGTFESKLKLRKVVDNKETEIAFSDKTSPSKFRLTT